MKFLTLYYKELRLELSSFILVAGAIVGLAFYSFVRIEEPTFRLALIGAIAVMLPFFGLLRLFQSLRSEWSEDTIQWSLTFPVSGWLPLGAKLAAVVTSLLVLSLLLVAIAYPLVLQTLVGDYFAELSGVFGTLFALVTVSYICFLPAVLFSYLVGRGLPKWRLPVVGFVFIASTYIFSKITENAAVHLPAWYITVKNIHITGESVIIVEELANISGIFGALLFGYMLFHASVRLWDRRIDV